MGLRRSRPVHQLFALFLEPLQQLSVEQQVRLHHDDRRLAVRRLMEDFYASQQAMTASAMRFALQAGGSLAQGVEEPSREWAESLVEAWITVNEEEAGRVDSVQRQLDASGAWTLSKLAIASTQLGEMAGVAQP